MTKHERRQLVFARNTLRRAANQIDFALETAGRGDVEVGLRAGFAWATANNGIRELRRATSRINKRAAS